MVFTMGTLFSVTRVTVYLRDGYVMVGLIVRGEKMNMIVRTMEVITVSILGLSNRAHCTYYIYGRT